MILAAARTILDRYRPDPERQPHLVMRINDPRQAGHWRGRHRGRLRPVLRRCVKPAGIDRRRPGRAAPPDRGAAAAAVRGQQPGAGYPAGTGPPGPGAAGAQGRRAGWVHRARQHPPAAFDHDRRGAARPTVGTRPLGRPGQLHRADRARSGGNRARVEHTRWSHRRLAAGWRPGDSRSSRRAADHGAILINSKVVPWAELPVAERGDEIDHPRSQLVQLEDVGFVPIVPAGGPTRGGRVPADRHGPGETIAHAGGPGRAGPATSCPATWATGASSTIRVTNGPSATWNSAPATSRSAGRSGFVPAPSAPGRSASPRSCGPWRAGPLRRQATGWWKATGANDGRCRTSSSGGPTGPSMGTWRRGRGWAQHRPGTGRS